MFIHINPARDICENAFKRVMVLFIDICVLAENCLQNLSFKIIKIVFYTLHFIGAINCFL
jgi:hypothetical protein